MTAEELAGIRDYTTFGTVYVIVGTDVEEALLRTVAGENPLIEARFWREADAQRAVVSMRRAHPWRSYRVVEVAS